nr:MAG TPA: hypothetical protein [Caudoviricetes sp.]
MILYNVGLFSCCKYIYLIYKMKKDNVKIDIILFIKHRLKSHNSRIYFK